MFVSTKSPSFRGGATVTRRAASRSCARRGRRRFVEHGDVAQRVEMLPGHALRVGDPVLLTACRAAGRGAFVEQRHVGSLRAGLQGGEFVGVIGLIMGGLLGFMIAFYLWRTRLKHAEDPSDNPVGDIDDISGDYGFFSPYSWWSLWLGLSAAICFLGLAVGWWVFAIGAFFAVPALIGWTFEYWKGAHHL